MGPRRRFLAGAERGSRLPQVMLNLHYERVRAAEHAPRGPFRVVGLAEIVERGAGRVERPAGLPHMERDSSLPSTRRATDIFLRTSALASSEGL